MPSFQHWVAVIPLLRTVFALNLLSQHSGTTKLIGSSFGVAGLNETFDYVVSTPQFCRFASQLNSAFLVSLEIHVLNYLSDLVVTNFFSSCSAVLI